LALLAPSNFLLGFRSFLSQQETQKPNSNKKLRETQRETQKVCRASLINNGGPQTQIGKCGPETTLRIARPLKKSIVMARWTRLDELVPDLTAPPLASSFRQLSQ
jgi:hypothetical protein